MLTLHDRLRGWQGKAVDIQLVSGITVRDRIVYMGKDYVGMALGGVVPLSAIVFVELAAGKDPELEYPEEADSYEDDDDPHGFQAFDPNDVPTSLRWPQPRRFTMEIAPRDDPCG